MWQKMAAGFKPPRPLAGEVGVNRECSYPLVCDGTPPLAALRTTNQRTKRDKIRRAKCLTAAADRMPRPQTPVYAWRGDFGNARISSAQQGNRETPMWKTRVSTCVAGAVASLAAAGGLAQAVPKGEG